MRHADIEKLCLSLKGAVLSIQWGEERVFKVGGKMFAMLYPASQRPHTLWFKASNESLHILTHVRHITPAPYLARAKWVCLERLDALPAKETRPYLVRAHAIVASGLTKKMRLELGIDDVTVPF